MSKKKRKPGTLSLAARIATIINSEMGKPVLRLGSDEIFIPMKIPTGSLVVDRVTGGGFTLGRHIEIYGDESACKSWIQLKTIALSQERGNIGALVDPEKTFDPHWFRMMGGIPEELLLFQPETEWTAEDAVGVMMMLASMIEEEERIEVVGVDSVAALVTKEEMSKDPRQGDDRIASQARMMSRALRRITTVNRRTLFIWTNQQRSNIGFGAQFNPHTQPGGRALRYYATTRLEMRKAGKVEEDKNVADKGELKKKKVKVGEWIQVKSIKDKSTVPHGQGQFIFDNRRGKIDFGSEIIQLGLEDEIIERSGNTYVYISPITGEVAKGSLKNFKRMLKEDDDLRDELVMAIKDQTIQLSRVFDGDS